LNERLERELAAIIAADLGDRFGDFNPDLVTAHRIRQPYDDLAPHRHSDW
jgi:hypothetical protein